jgi:hypothetical protein
MSSIDWHDAAFHGRPITMHGKTSDAFARLARLARFLRTTPPGLSVADAQVLADALEQHVARGVPLDVALGLRLGRGERTVRTITTHALRDALLRTIARQFFPDLTIDGQAHAIADAWSRYAATAWLRERALQSPPTHRAGRLEFMLFELQQLYPRPLAWRRLFGILARD